MRRRVGKLPTMENINEKKYFKNAFPPYKCESEHGPGAIASIQALIDNKWETSISQIHSYYNKENADQKLDTDGRNETVYTGSAGLAMLYLLKFGDNEKYLRIAKEFTPVIKVIGSEGCPTFLCGYLGVMALRAVICHKLKEDTEMHELLQTILKVCSQKRPLSCELMYGHVGMLFTMLYLNKHINPPPCEDKIIKVHIDLLLKQGRTIPRELHINCPVMYAWHDSLYLGAAHGISGILYVILQAVEYLNKKQLDNIIKPTVDYLATLKLKSGNFLSSLHSQSGDRYVQWCHGAPGFVYLFSQAYKVFENPEYLEHALEAAEVVWQRGLLKKGYSLCHGVAGNGYCFLELYQTTKDPKHLYRAMKFAEWCLHYSKKYEEHTPDHPFSLYEGMAGPLYFLQDIEDPMNAKFPGYTL